MLQILAGLFLAVTPAAVRPPLPADWSSLPEPPYRGATGITSHDTGPVMQMQGRCRFPRIRRGWRGVRVESALLVAPGGRLLDVVPDPAACGPLRAYLVGLYAARLRGRLNGPDGEEPAWYRATITFSWEE